MRFGLIALLMTAFLLAACSDKDKPSATASPGTSATPAVGPSASTRPGTTPAGSDGVGGFILNEVRFAAAPGAPAFVELKNITAARSSPSGLVLKGSTTFPMPADAPEVERGGVLVITFDGDGATSGTVLHALDSAFPGAGTGTLSLLNGNTEWDRVTWGDGSLAPGGAITEPPPNSVAARVPAGGESGSPWALLGPSQATPGTPNPAPAVSAFATPDGSVFPGPSARLAWYSVPGATSYRVELSANSSFDPLLADETVTATRPGALTPESVSVEALAPGLYHWRVTAVYPSGAAAVSEARLVGVRAGPGAAAVAARTTPVEHAGAAALAAMQRVGMDARGVGAVQEPPTNPLKVPQINQRKDTAMLQLENPSEDGPLAWDKPDADKPLRPYCVYAAVAMLNRFYRGDWSVDYAHYVALRDQAPGPERDLQERGANPREWRRAIHEALGVDPGPVKEILSSADLQSFYSTVRAEIDAGRPLAAVWPYHAVLIIGYADRDEFGNFSIVVQDGNGKPWARSEAPDLADVWLGYFTIPPGAAGARQPAGVTRDGDGDGVVDFDESDRFGLSSGETDSDGDELDDKQDIRAGTWDERHGYARRGPGRDFDRDGIPMERDPDADDGGCFDGMEDENGDGKFDAGVEIDNFERGDDPCIGGSYLIVLEQLIPGEGTSTRTNSNSRALVSLEPEVDGRLTGRAIVTYFLEMQMTTSDSTCPFIEVPRITIPGVSILTGELVAGKLQIKADPEKGPPFTATASGCGISQTNNFDEAVWFSGWGTIEFTNGRYDYRLDYPLPAGVTGEFYVEVHLRQPGS
jgi:hypothetical protein